MFVITFWYRLLNYFSWCVWAPVAYISRQFLFTWQFLKLGDDDDAGALMIPVSYSFLIDSTILIIVFDVRHLTNNAGAGAFSGAPDDIVLLLFSKRWWCSCSDPDDHSPFVFRWCRKNAGDDIDVHVRDYCRSFILTVRYLKPFIHYSSMMCLRTHVCAIAW